jgi:tetratricopeptide (TPR) repeat protein
MDRLAAFRSFIEKSPRDPFPRYGLAMELRNRGQLTESADAFAALLTGFPDYVPAYLMAGNTLAELGRRGEAADAYRRGIDTATVGGDLHAKKELETALAELTEG